MNKSELVDALYEEQKAGIDKPLTKGQIDRVIGDLATVVVAQLAKDDKVAIFGLGTFSAPHRAARTARNPQTGEPIQIPARRAPHFSASKAMKDALK